MNNKALFYSGIGFAVVFGSLFALAASIGFGVGFQASFWFGFGLIGAFVVGAIGLIATVQIAGGVTTSIKTSRKIKAWAFIIGGVTLLIFAGLVLGMIIMQFALIGAVFNGNNVWLGVISAIIVAIGIASYPGFGLLAVHLNKSN